MAMQAQKPRSGDTESPRVFLASTSTRSIDADYTWDDLEERIELTPHDAQVRGMFLREVVRLAGPRIQTTEKRYVPFTMYSQREYMSLLVSVARAKYTNRTPADALLSLGLGVYELLANSLAGTAIFAIANLNFKTICEVAPKGYSVTLSQAHARCVSSSDGEAQMELRKVWIFPEVFHTGIWLGAMEASRVTGTIEARRMSPCNVDLHMRWKPR